MKSIALVMIVRDEEAVLDRCLESVKAYVDDMIIVDTGSTDSTIDIARSHHARIYQYKWKDDFSKARNEALKYSTCDFNLVLDADEYVIKWHKTAVSNFLESSSQQIGRLKIFSDFNTSTGTDTSWSYISRLFPNGIYYKGIIHEQLDSNLPRKMLPIEVHHDGYHHHRTDKNKQIRNIPLLEKALKENPQSIYYRYKLAMDYKGTGDNIKALGYMDTAYNTKNYHSSIWNALVEDYIYLLMDCKSYEKALKVIQEEEEYIHNDAGFYFVSGLLYVKLILSDVKKYINYFKKIESSFRKCLEIGENNSERGVVGTGSFAAWYNLGVFYEMTKRIKEAKECYEKAAAYNYAPAIDRLKKLG